MFALFRVKDCFIGIERNIRADILGYLQSTSISQSQPNKIVKRRASVSGGGLYSIGGRIRESGADYFLPYPRGSFAINANASNQEPGKEHHIFEPSIASGKISNGKSTVQAMDIEQTVDATIENIVEKTDASVVSQRDVTHTDASAENEAPETDASEEITPTMSGRDVVMINETRIIAPVEPMDIDELPQETDRFSVDAIEEFKYNVQSASVVNNLDPFRPFGRKRSNSLFSFRRPSLLDLENSIDELEEPFE